MDYGARFNSDVHGLGKYDTAAIRFGYGQLFDMHPSGATQTAWTGLRNDITLRDYIHSCPCHRPAASDKFDTAATTVAAVQGVHRPVDGRTSGSLSTNGERRSPCSPSGPTSSATTCSRATSTARPGTAGANQQEMVSNVTEQFRNYYAFNAYRRGRINWDIDGYLYRLQERYFNRYSEAFQFFFFLSDYMTVRPRRRPVPGVGRFAELDRGDPADAGAGPALPDGAQPDRRDVPGGRLRLHRRSLCLPASRKLDDRPARREAVLHRLLRRLLLHVHARRVAATRSCRRWSRSPARSRGSSASTSCPTSRRGRRSTTTGCSATRWSSCCRA